jgi:PKD repeat protein
LVKKVVAAIFMCAVMVLVAAVPLAMADTHTILKGEKGPRASALTWNYEPESFGNWYGHIVNSGLRSLVVDVYDNTTGMPDQMSHQRIRFAAYDVYPSGTVDTAMVTMAPGRLYEITVTPNGPKGSTCTVEDMFVIPHAPVAVITVVSVDFLTVAVSGSLSTDDGTIVSYEWNFGDGSTVMGMDATHTYAKDGTYTITLLVTDNEGLAGSATELVTVQHQMLPPVASFTATMDWMIVSVDGSASTDNYGPIASYDWNFGDGLTGTGVTASHIYAVEGPYTITLTVTDSDGMTGTASKDVQAMKEHVNLPPVAMITATITFLNVAVDSVGSNDPDGSIVSYAWLFGDGASAIGPTASHTYAGDGTFTITLTVKDNMDATGAATEIVTVQHEHIPPVASFTATMSFMAVSLDASASTDNYGPIASYDWNFGDGMTGTGMIATHTYALEGPYTITLTVTDSDGQTGTASKDVTAVKPIEPKPPVASFTATVTYLTVAVDASASSDPDGTISAYAWAWGDGTTGTGKTATHSYATAGVKTITLTVTDNSGLTGTTTRTVTTVNPPQPPVASFTYTTNNLIVSVNAAGSSDPDGTITSYSWNWGDGTAAGTGVTATHTYAAAGVKTITLTVTDNSGMTGTTSQDVTVSPAPQPPVASFTATVTYLSVAVNAAGSFDPDGTISSYSWNWGDGTAAGTGVTATHVYATAGSKTITLTVTDNSGLTGTTTRTVTTVNPPQPPVASFTATVTYLSVAVNAAASSDPDGTITSYSWNWGDGTADGTGVTATHVYATAGAKTITLTVTDNSGLTGTTTRTVTTVNPPQPPVASFTATVTYLSVAVNAAASSDPDGTISSYSWNWGDGTAAGTGVTATHVYATAGSKTITLTVTDNSGLTGTTTRTVTTVNPPQPPVASFTATVTYLSVAVNAAASSDPDGTISSYSWNWGDGTADGTGVTATHVYATAGSKTITLTVTDNSGMTASASKDVVATLPPAPVASFTATVTGMTVNVDASASTGTGLSYAWTWGDGTTGTGVTATHTYAAAAMVVHVSSGRVPGPPHAVFGFTTDANGDPVNGAIVSVTNVRTGETIVWDETRESWDPNMNIYSVDCSEFQLIVPPATQSWVTGDILHVEATKGTYTGFTDAPITNTPEGYDIIDVVLYPGAAPTYTITLLVTDSFGRTATISRDVTLSP